MCAFKYTKHFLTAYISHNSNILIFSEYHCCDIQCICQLTKQEMAQIIGEMRFCPVRKKEFALFLITIQNSPKTTCLRKFERRHIGQQVFAFKFACSWALKQFLMPMILNDTLEQKCRCVSFPFWYKYESKFGQKAGWQGLGGAMEQSEHYRKIMDMRRPGGAWRACLGTCIICTHLQIQIQNTMTITWTSPVGRWPN